MATMETDKQSQAVNPDKQPSFGEWQDRLHQFRQTYGHLLKNLTMDKFLEEKHLEALAE